MACAGVLTHVCDACPALLAADLDGAFGAFVGHHQDLVFGLAMRLARRPADAEDLAQDTFVRAYRALRSYERREIEALRPKGWLAAIVLNLGRNRIRDARRRVSPESLDAGDDTGDLAPDPGETPDLVAERREAAREWADRLAGLPPRYRRAVELRHVDGLSYPELAEATGVPLGTAKSDVHRGVAMLRRVLATERDGSPAGRS